MVVGARRASSAAWPNTRCASCSMRSWSRWWPRPRPDDDGRIDAAPAGCRIAAAPRPARACTPQCATSSGALLWRSPSLRARACGFGPPLAAGRHAISATSTCATATAVAVAEPRPAVGSKRAAATPTWCSAWPRSMAPHASAAAALSPRTGRLVHAADAAAAGVLGWLLRWALAPLRRLAREIQRSGARQREQPGRRLAARAGRRRRATSTRCCSRSARASRAIATRSATWRTA